MKRKAKTTGSSPQDLARELAGAGLRATNQRLAVLARLQAATDHPSVPELHRALRRTERRISRKTVYSILDRLVRAGLARSVSDGAEAVRYEGRRDRHYHARCRRCDRLFDLPARADSRIRAVTVTPPGFEVEEIAVTLRGLCAACRRTRGRP